MLSGEDTRNGTKIEMGKQSGAICLGDGNSPTLNLGTRQNLSAALEVKVIVYRWPACVVLCLERVNMEGKVIVLYSLPR